MARRRVMGARKGAGKKAQKKLATVGEVKSIIHRNLQNKRYDDKYGPTDVIASGTFTNLTSLIQKGTEPYERSGDKINLLKLQMKGYMYTVDGVTADVYNQVRIIIFRWRQSSASNMDPVLDVSTNASRAILQSTGSIYVSDLLNIDNKDKYHIIYDKVFPLKPIWGSDSSGQAGNEQVQNGLIQFELEFYGKKLGAKGVNYVPSSNEGTNHLYVLTVSDSTTTAHPQLAYSYRLTYENA